MDTRSAPCAKRLVETLITAIYLCRELNNHPEQTNKPDAEKIINVSYVTALGTDAISNGMVTWWEDEGISTGLILRDNIDNNITHPGSN